MLEVGCPDPAEVLDRTESTRSCWPSSAASARSASVMGRWVPGAGSARAPPEGSAQSARLARQMIPYPGQSPSNTAKAVAFRARRTAAAQTRENPARLPRSAPRDTQFVQDKFEGPRGPGESLRSAESAVTAGLGQVRLQRHEALEAGVPQRRQRLADLPVALACGHDLARRGERVLDLQVDQVRPEQAVCLVEGPDAALDEVRRVERRPQRRGSSPSRSGRCSGRECRRRSPSRSRGPAPGPARRRSRPGRPSGR